MVLSQVYDDAMARAGKFITFEGLDGCGKTTQLEKLATALRAQNIDVVVTREPGGTPIGEKIRAVLLDSRTAGLAPMFASRAQHISQVILPAVHKGKWVLCDRFSDSSEAYQGGGRQMGSTVVLELHQIVCGNLQPDLTILLESEVKSSVARARHRNENARALGNDEGRFEMEAAAFFERVKETYLTIAQREPERVVRVNAARSVAEVHEEIIRAVSSRLFAGATAQNPLS
jgi:dTMP kinase